MNPLFERDVPSLKFTPPLFLKSSTWLNGVKSNFLSVPNVFITLFFVLSPIGIVSSGIFGQAR